MLLVLVFCLLSILHFTQVLASGQALTNHGRKGAVASLAADCTEIGIDLMKKGGNAADAIVGTQFCLGVERMFLTGNGGGGFMLVRAPNGTYKAIDFRECAPAAASTDMYNQNVNKSLYGGLASGVPGEVHGLWTLHSEYGLLPWCDVVQPSVDLAYNGFKVDKQFVEHMDELTSDFLTTDPAWAIDFAPNGTRVGLGDTITRKRYSAMLDQIAKRGPKAFYEGPIAKSTIEALRRAGGIMTMEDLKNYTALERTSVTINYRNYKLTSVGAPSSGVVTLNIMKTIEGYSSFEVPSLVNISTFRLNEAMRFGYGARTNLGDPSFNDTIAEYELRMLEPVTAVDIRNRITDDHTHPVSYYNPDNIESLETPGTSHVVAVDESGMAISMTSTVNTDFGSGVMVPETGLVMNNEMNDFSIPNTPNEYGYAPSPANFIKPGKRPLSSISPVIVESLETGEIYFITGASGGSYIITATLESLWRVLDEKLTATEAVAAPRFHDQLIPNQVLFEYHYPNATVEYMKEKGCHVSWEGRLSGVNVILRQPDGVFEAASEPWYPDSAGYAY